VLIGLLEDDIAIQEMVRLMLESDGHELVSFALASDCLEALRVDDPEPGAFNPSLLIVDQRLPRETPGTSVIEHIRVNPRLYSLPIILMTASTLPDKQVLERLRVTVISKPFDMDTFLHTITNLTGHTPV
jgi:CheY-like chemotaxis protein